ncbi:hypothetical protein DPQ22_03505 [Candidatus Tokpelaia sp.]|nr:hypothetical protein DPQ22_03505 [Candidatus Tokpelaia sp.]
MPAQAALGVIFAYVCLWDGFCRAQSMVCRCLFCKRRERQESGKNSQLRAGHALKPAVCGGSAQQAGAAGGRSGFLKTEC